MNNSSYSDATCPRRIGDNNLTLNMSKRPKLHRVSSCQNCQKNQSQDDHCHDLRSQDVHCHTLETLPPEVLEMILRFLTLGDVAGSIRSVSRRCSTVATTVLNGAFVTAGSRLDAAMAHVESTMAKAATEAEVLAWSKAFNVLELIKAQYKMLKAVTWRYTHPPKSANFKRLSFYAGSLLDEMNSIISIARSRPGSLFSNCSTGDENRAGNEVSTILGVSPRLAGFVALCKRFMNYFEKVSECRLNRSALVSGCKAVDVLDCLAEGRHITSFRVSSGRIAAQGQKNGARSGRSGSIVTMGLRYVMRRAWFTCLQVPCAPDENSWREDQRFMYLRLRRLVGSVNEHHFEKCQYERDVMLRATRTPSQQPKPPSPSTYSGYGVYSGRFFYYGNMNKYAYESKFKDLNGILSDDSDREIDEDEEDESERRLGPARGPPAFDLVIRVELRCSSDLAPLAVTSSLRTDELQINDKDDAHRYSLDQPQEHSELYLKLHITCPASSTNRLPSNFTWEQWGPTHPRQKRQRFTS